MITRRTKPFIPGDKTPENVVAHNRKEAREILSLGYTMTPELLKKLNNYFHRVIIEEDKKDEISCQFLQIGDKKIQAQGSRRKNSIWLLPIDQFCENVNTKKIKLHFS